jgi:Aminotransferase class-V
MAFASGRHFLQIPGPTNVPDRVLRAIDRPTIDHRSQAFARLGRDVLEGMQRVLQTRGKVFIFPASGTGAWEAALVNTLSPGDRVLMFDTGHFATLWRNMAARFGIEVDFVAGDWRHGADPNSVAERLAADSRHAIKAVMVVHNETSTGVTSRIPHIRRAIDAAQHPALLMVDTISSRLDRLPARRMECRRHRGRLAEGADAAAGALLQRGVGQGAGREPGQPAAALVLGLAGHGQAQSGRLFSVHPGDEPAVRIA